MIEVAVARQHVVEPGLVLHRELHLHHVRDVRRPGGAGEGELVGRELRGPHEDVVRHPRDVAVHHHPQVTDLEVPVRNRHPGELDGAAAPLVLVLVLGLLRLRGQGGEEQGEGNR